MSPATSDVIPRSMQHYKPQQQRNLMPTSTCFNCQASEMERPLITLKFQGRELTICPQCLPRLIHKPEQLADKFPGSIPFETSTSDEH